MKINNLKKLNIEDFPQESQEIVEKLAFAINPLLDLITNAFTKNIDFDNLNRELITFEVELDASGKPKAKLELRTTLRTKSQGLNVIRAENLSLDGTFPTSCPFITFSINNSNLAITHISGLPANKKYRLTIESIG